MGEALLFTTNQDLVMTSENVLNTGADHRQQAVCSARGRGDGPVCGQYYFYQYDVRGA